MVTEMGQLEKILDLQYNLFIDRANLVNIFALGFFFGSCIVLELNSTTSNRIGRKIIKKNFDVNKK